VASNLDIFRKEYLEANTWAQRRDGIPLELLDNLSNEELKIAERELINAASLHDSWPIVGLGHIKSKDSLSTLHQLLEKSTGAMKVKIAHSIFQISHDEHMKEIVLETMPTITSKYELIDVLYYLPKFKDERITKMHHAYRNHKDYLVVYNATRYLGLPTDEVVERFKKKDKRKGLWERLFG
jgi:hypothetical protein